MFPIKQGEKDSESLLGQCLNQTGCYSNVWNKQEEDVWTFTAQVVFAGHDWPDKCTEWWSAFQPQFGPNPFENWHQMPGGGKTNPEMSLFDWVPSTRKHLESTDTEINVHCECRSIQNRWRNNQTFLPLIFDNFLSPETSHGIKERPQTSATKWKASNIKKIKKINKVEVWSMRKQFLIVIVIQYTTKYFCLKNF